MDLPPALEANLVRGQLRAGPPQFRPDALRRKALSAEGRLLVFGMDEMKELSGGKGVILMGLNDGEKLVAARAIDHAVTVRGLARGDKPAELVIDGEELMACLGKRARKGKALAAKWKAFLGL